LKNTGQTI